MLCTGTEMIQHLVFSNVKSIFRQAYVSPVSLDVK
jgi:hypothetical protein